MYETQIRRLLEAYPAIFLAAHRQHVRSDEGGKSISERQASVLDHLDEKHGATLSKLAEHMGVGRSAMSIMVSRLARGGYIVRRRDEKDARCVALKLTRRGARVKEENAILEHDLLKSMFRMMPAAELESALLGVESFAKYARILLRRRKRARG